MVFLGACWWSTLALLSMVAFLGTSVHSNVVAFAAGTEFGRLVGLQKVRGALQVV